VDKEAAEIKVIAADADADLQAALPALEMANEGLKNLDKQKLAEIKGYSKPPQGVDVVCYAIMIIMGKDPTWASVKKELAAPDFLAKMQQLDKDHISQRTLLRIERMTSDPNMSQSKIDSISAAGGSMWRWVTAIEQYAKAFKDIEPKKAKVTLLREKLQKAEDELQSLQDNFKKLQDTIKELQNRLLQAQRDQEDFKEQTKILSEKQDRAEKLIMGLEGTKEGWAVRKQGLEVKYDYLIGDTLMSAAFMSYAGPFPSEYR
jgi:dynein heavy chain